MHPITGNSIIRSILILPLITIHLILNIDALFLQDRGERLPATAIRIKLFENHGRDLVDYASFTISEIGIVID